MLRALLTVALLALAACPSTPKTAGPAVPPDAPAKPAAPADAGPRAEGTGYTLEAVPPAAAVVGQPAESRVVLRTRDGYHINKEYPLEITLTVPAGLEAAKASYELADAPGATEAEASFPVVVTPREAGARRVSAVVDFGICITPPGGRQQCLQPNQTLVWEVGAK
jgi:hypothetical protein